MFFQFEDIVNTLRALYSTNYDFVFFFDHSSGHDKNRPDGLNENTINKFYGGNKAKMRDTKIENETYLGKFSHPRKLKVGDVQSMIFEDDDIGPFYLSAQEKAEKIDRESKDQETMKQHTRSELIELITQKTTYRHIRGELSKLQKLATSMDIPIEYKKRKYVKVVSENPKGCCKSCGKEDSWM